MKKVYIVHMEDCFDNWFDTNVYADKEKAEERLAELEQKESAWCSIEELTYCD